MAEEECLYLGNHTRAPTSPGDWHRWSKKMLETHVQTQCPGCNQWVVWKPKTPVSQ